MTTLHSHHKYRTTESGLPNGQELRNLQVILKCLRLVWISQPMQLVNRLHRMPCRKHLHYRTDAVFRMYRSLHPSRSVHRAHKNSCHLDVPQVTNTGTRQVYCGDPSVLSELPEAAINFSDQVSAREFYILQVGLGHVN